MRDDAQTQKKHYKVALKLLKSPVVLPCANSHLTTGLLNIYRLGIIDKVL